MSLRELLYGISYKVIKGELNIEISNITYDSENVQPEDLFICVKGTKFDGHNYINEAIKKGAVVIIVDHPISRHINEDVTIIMVADTRRALANISANYFGNPAKCCTMIGITGTKGKTTTSNMIKNILEYNHKRVGLIGTNGAKIGEAILEIDNTTPLSYQIHKLLRFMVDQGCEYIVMEVSSQGLKMARVEGIEFDYAIFTNISFDHIGENEHKSIEEYKYWKSRLFMQTKVGIINGDMAELRNIIKDSNCKLYSYGIAIEKNSLEKIESNSIYATDVRLIKSETYLGSECKIYDTIIGVNYPIKIMVAGVFNIYNALAAITCCSLIFMDEAKKIEPKKEAIEFIEPKKSSVNVESIKKSSLKEIKGKKKNSLELNHKGKETLNIRRNSENKSKQLRDDSLNNKETYIKNLEEAFGKFYVKGRVELVYGCDKFHIMIDYAHNEMSMEELLKTLRLYNPKRLVCLFGCGGNRSKLRRYSMGEIGGKYADFCIITEDNSRLEPPEQIVDDILIGMAKTTGEYIVIYDRREAIKYAIENAKSGDLIVLIGKGHENYQDKNGTKTHFSEHEIVSDILLNL